MKAAFGNKTVADKPAYAAYTKAARIRADLGNTLKSKPKASGKKK